MQISFLKRHTKVKHAQLKGVTTVVAWGPIVDKQFTPVIEDVFLIKTMDDAKLCTNHCVIHLNSHKYAPNFRNVIK
jgi:hypothetical protein